MHDRNPGWVCNRSCRPRPLETAVALHQRRSSCGSAWWPIGGYPTRSGIYLLRVARSVADLNGEGTVSADAVAEASHYRCSDVMGSREPSQLTNSMGLGRHIPIGLWSDRRWFQVTILSAEGMDHRFTQPMEPMEHRGLHLILLSTIDSVETLTTHDNG